MRARIHSEIKLKKGGTYKIKNITLDDRDDLLDSVAYEYNDDGSIRGVTMMHSTMTKWLRTCLDEKNVLYWLYFMHKRSYCSN